MHIPRLEAPEGRRSIVCDRSSRAGALVPAQNGEIASDPHRSVDLATKRPFPDVRMTVH